MFEGSGFGVRVLALLTSVFMQGKKFHGSFFVKPRASLSNPTMQNAQGGRGSGCADQLGIREKYSFSLLLFDAHMSKKYGGYERRLAVTSRRNQHLKSNSPAGNGT